jgi:hypothetical protein
LSKGNTLSHTSKSEKPFIISCKSDDFYLISMPYCNSIFLKKKIHLPQRESQMAKNNFFKSSQVVANQTTLD